MTLLQRVDLIDQAFAEVGAEENFIRSNFDRFSARFGEIFLCKRFEFLDSGWIAKKSEETWQIAIGIEGIDLCHQRFQVLSGEFPGEVRPVAFTGNFRDHENSAAGGQLVG